MVLSIPVSLFSVYLLFAYFRGTSDGSLHLLSIPLIFMYLIASVISFFRMRFAYKALDRSLRSKKIIIYNNIAIAMLYIVSFFLFQGLMNLLTKQNNM